MGSLRDIRRRIASVKNTRQITRAMKMVAGAKLRRATNAATAAKPYQQSLSRMLERVVASAGEIEHPLLETPENENDVLIAVISSDRGLCGGFNNQLFRKLGKDIAALKADGKTVRLLCYGKKARSHFGARDYTVLESFVDLAPENYSQIADALADKLAVAMGKSEFSQAYVAYNEYISVMKQQASLVSVLPMRLDDEDGEDGAGGEYLYEPDGTQILAHLLPTALRTQIFQAFLESQAGEQAARMRAMDSATRNASELIDTLTLDYNRARQAAITTELTEIVSGAEAL